MSILNATHCNQLVKIESVAQEDFPIQLTVHIKMSGMKKDGSEISELFLLFRHKETIQCSKISQTSAKTCASKQPLEQ